MTTSVDLESVLLNKVCQLEKLSTTRFYYLVEEKETVQMKEKSELFDDKNKMVGLKERGT